MNGPDTSRVELRQRQAGPVDAGPVDAGPVGTAGRADDGDLDLLHRHVAGDPDAFVQLFENHRHRLWRVALGLLGDAGDAEDALQDAMLSAHRKAADFEARSTVATWLHRIVVNAALSQLRRRKVRPTSPMPVDADGAQLEPPDPRDAVAQSDLHLDLVRALADLPDEMRTTVVLVDVHGYPVAEVAKLLSVPEGTVKSRCSRGRARLASALGHLRPGNPSALHAVSLEGRRQHDHDSPAPPEARVSGSLTGHGGRSGSATATRDAGDAGDAEGGDRR